MIERSSSGTKSTCCNRVMDACFDGFEHALHFCNSMMALCLHESNHNDKTLSALY